MYFLLDAGLASVAVEKPCFPTVQKQGCPNNRVGVIEFTPHMRYTASLEQCQLIHLVQDWRAPVAKSGKDAHKIEDECLTKVAV